MSPERTRRIIAAARRLVSLEAVLERVGRIAVRHPILVVLTWIVIAAVLTLTLPSLNEAVRRNAVDVFPSDSPSVTGMNAMAAAFHEDGLDNAVIVVMTDGHGLEAADEPAYAALAGQLRGEHDAVRSVQDFLVSPQLRDTLSSDDGKAWCMLVGLNGVLGSTEANAAYDQVQELVESVAAQHSFAIDVTGPPAAVGDLFQIGDEDLKIIEVVTVALIAAILLAVYRSVTTALIALGAIGVSLVVAQAAISGLAQLGMSVSVIAVALVTAILIGAGTDYTIFMISRYHEHLRQGINNEEAVLATCRSMGRVLAASAATVGFAFLAMSLVQLGAFASLGLANAVAIGVAFAGSVTLLPAVLVLAGRRGWVRPALHRTDRVWRRSGIQIVRHPQRYLAASLVVLVALASVCLGLRFSYDDRDALPASAMSNVGYDRLEQHLSLTEFLPHYVYLTSSTDLRTARALADLEQMAVRLGQLRDVRRVSGITRPTGIPITEAAVSFQADEIGRRLGNAAKAITDNTGNLDRLSDGAIALAAGMQQMKTQIDAAMRAARGLLVVLSDIDDTVSAPEALAEADRVFAFIRDAAPVWNGQLRDLTSVVDAIGAVVPILDGSAACDQNLDCARVRGLLAQLAGDGGRALLTNLIDVSEAIAQIRSDRPISTTVGELRQQLLTALDELARAGVDQPSNITARADQLQAGVDQLAAGSQQLSGAVTELVGQTRRMGTELQAAASYLQQVGSAAQSPSMAGFYLPPAAFENNQFAAAARFFVSDDGHSVRYLVESTLDPYSTAAMDQVNELESTVRQALPNTSLESASVTVTGFPAINRDLRSYYHHDFLFIVVATVLIVFAILAILLRAVVAPLYLVLSVLVSYTAALGIGVIVFQVIGGRELAWSTPAMAFIILVAVGADYNLLLVLRIREETRIGIRAGVIRTIASTGGVITSAGVIFAASMFGLLFGSINSMIELGVIMGTGLLLDTFLVRTVTVPALAVLSGRAFWWPSTR